MFDFTEIWSDTSIPWETRKKEILDLLCYEEYGALLPKPDNVSWTVEPLCDLCGGKTEYKKVQLTAKWGDKSFTFPFLSLIQKSEKKTPFIVNINFDKEIPNRYFEPELFCEKGVSVFYLYYKDVTSDNDDFTNGLAGVLYPDGKRRPHDPGKIAMWAWATQRVLDYGLSLDALDGSRAAVAGHSRLGKTALLAGASDSRFTHVFCNESGCSGAALSRGKEGETIEDICRKFGYWFCDSYKQYAGNEQSLPFDQHFLLGAIAPARLCVGSADEDRWAGPLQEYQSCVLASEVYEKLGLTGLVAPDREPRVGDNFSDGMIAYHYRDGKHAFRHDDWEIYCDCLLNK